ncbi:spermidine/putrescine import ATP-binding protein PotA [Striga asiatica]|uniref:Spermidine/putrescine import ATP-binding protein PotA n=1 Tax=Striga asiatica TaxID=4170 RepID=A0A5A7R8X1_STRAF|nr:spermidine/putrescine import ATP-binding protein PotA [Striga asiatica]
MAHKKEELRLERRSISDALLLTTMCIIGMPVDVHAIDDSVYSGILHTAWVDKEYGILGFLLSDSSLLPAIVLKKATMIKKGDLDANVVNGTLIETLVVRSKDLVQGAVLPAYAEVLKSNEPEEKTEHLYQLRQVADGSQEIQSDFNNSLGFLDQRTMDEAQVSSPSSEFPSYFALNKFDKLTHLWTASITNMSLVLILDCSISVSDIQVSFNVNVVNSFVAQSTGALNITEGTVQHEPTEVSSGRSSAHVDKDQGRLTPNESVCTVISPPDICDASVPTLEVESDSRLRASSDPFMWVPPRSSSVKKTAKESKLNHGAQRFYPSMLYHRMVEPHVRPNGTGVPYRPGACALASRGHVTFGHGDNNTPYFQPVMFGRGGGPLVYTNPIPSLAPGLSPATPRPPLAPHQLYLREHQGNWSSQELRHYMIPPLVANGPQSYVMPSSLPIPQPILPFVRPIAIPGTHGYLSTKFV